MGMWVGRGRKARICYGFDEIALVPGSITINPNDVDISWKIRDLKVDIPILAAAMDGVVDTNFAIEMGKLGGLAVLNLEGIQTRYPNPKTILDEVASVPDSKATHLIQTVYAEPIKEELIGKRIQEIKAAKVPAIVSAIPQRAYQFGKLAQEAGADIFVVQATVSTVKHISSEYETVDFKKLSQQLSIPLIVGNCVTYNVALELMECGIDGLLIGVGPGAACTTRGVLGIGVPQVTATADTAAARDFYYKQTGRYVPIITDGGMSVGGDICKAFASGADAVMVGSSFAKAIEAPGKGHHWGMATPHANLPRGTRIRVGTSGTLKQILHGPAVLDDGSQNLVGALRTSMGNCGAKNIREMQLTELIIAPAIKTEGKLFQQQQHVGMGK
ncbi:MAG: GuaB3 family IMP dehydrogenase-related protein [Candidatus Schekmanbacteria bacterium]|nr:GuaB3 family IMP dehydrogenase-related protein [Candidatus Schekmanbacteria bacterium]